MWQKWQKFPEINSIWNFLLLSRCPGLDAQREDRVRPRGPVVHGRRRGLPRALGLAQQRVHVLGRVHGDLFCAWVLFGHACCAESCAEYAEVDLGRRVGVLWTFRSWLHPGRCLETNTITHFTLCFLNLQDLRNCAPLQILQKVAIPCQNVGTCSYFSTE